MIYRGLYRVYGFRVARFCDLDSLKGGYRADYLGEYLKGLLRRTLGAKPIAHMLLSLPVLVPTRETVGVLSVCQEAGSLEDRKRGQLRHIPETNKPKARKLRIPKPRSQQVAKPATQ